MIGTAVRAGIGLEMLSVLEIQKGLNVLIDYEHYVAAGAALMGTLVTSAAGVTFYQLLARSHEGVAVSPDWVLGLLFGIGGMAGMYFGARLQKYVPARAVKAVLTVCILALAVSYIGAFSP